MIRGALIAVLAALVLASCGGDSGQAELTDVSGVFDLRAAFNADEGRPRVLVLLSPT